MSMGRESNISGESFSGSVIWNHKTLLNFLCIQNGSQVNEVSAFFFCNFPTIATVHRFISKMLPVHLSLKLLSCLEILPVPSPSLIVIPISRLSVLPVHFSRSSRVLPVHLCFILRKLPSVTAWESCQSPSVTAWECCQSPSATARECCQSLPIDWCQSQSVLAVPNWECCHPLTPTWWNCQGSLYSLV